jgi:hypothetical protein
MLRLDGWVHSRTTRPEGKRTPSPTIMKVVKSGDSFVSDKLNRRIELFIFLPFVRREAQGFCDFWWYNDINYIMYRFVVGNTQYLKTRVSDFEVKGIVLEI